MIQDESRTARRLLPDVAATQAFAGRLAAVLRRGDAVLLEGVLGAGKTTLVRSVLRQLTADAALEVPSPSYTLVQSYDTPIGPVHHLDLWRLAGPAALPELGWDEALQNVVLVEWPDRLGAASPPGALHLELRLAEREARLASWSGWPAGRLA